ncbi:MAG: site-specific integrase [Bacteroidota bacterium]|nr:site-specific integrase [Bacteroidota bacterium]
MKQRNITVTIVPDKRRLKDNVTYPLKLRVTYKGERKYYATGYNASLNDYLLLMENKVRGELRKTNFALREIQINAQKCCDGLENFSFLKFEASFFPKKVTVTNLQSGFDSYINELEANEQIGTASSCISACVSLHKYKAGLKFEHITPEFLRSYERWFVGQGKSITTVGIYLRALRAVINVSIKQGLMNLEDYPFGKGKYIIPTGRNIKKSLTLEEIAKIYNYVTEPGSVDDMCRDYWIFIYLCNGLNVKDLCLLTYKNIQGDFIVFNRAKTIRSRRSNPEPIRIALKDDSNRIIAKWGQHELSQDTYIFPYLKPAMTPQKQRDNIGLLIHLINEHMKQIAIELGICKPITTYYARHSFATILKNSGVSTEFICEALGHTSLQTTKNYLAGFEQEAIRKTTDVLTSFKNNLKIA